MNLFQETDRLLQNVQKALTTFRQGELDLSVLGQWKYGQQDFIGALTGIWDNQPFYFPATIHNTTNMKLGDIRADLTFYTRAEMLEIVRNLISTIAEDYLLENDLEFDDMMIFRIFVFPIWKCGLRTEMWQSVWH